MAKDTIFHCTEGMVETSNSSDVVRTALTADEIRTNYRPANSHIAKKDVQSVERPVRGRPY